ncbi:hypothetical protein UCDDS831_g04367 [Diplodia seriata]|uniref:Uncharacterized protein n=1 Tax=Diplodia seriata TaxID=420778 RepID=A0A0G2EFT1_9PEZI|nr:hypothetical protein UCDDS831_g04367 [Diplodia seriata]
MNSLQVSVAVSAVASAFHSGAELLKQLKKQRKKRKGEDAYREKALLESLENGETQIEQHYAADCQELGQTVRIGDAIARERLLHIAVSLQSDVIRSLQIATRNDSAVVDLTALHEASVMLRRDTLTALAELRQRAINEKPAEYRQRLNSDAGYSSSISSIQRSSLSNSQRSRSSTNFSDNLPPAVTILNTEEKPKSVLFNRGQFESDRKFDPSHFPDSPRPIHPLERESMDQQQIEALSLNAAANNYYNFCKGAWSLREEFKKGLTVRNKPVGMYTSCLVWQCKECNFEGPSFGNKKPYMTDPRTYTFVHELPSSGASITVRYKWIFLAKNHVKIKSGLLRPTATENEQTVSSLNGFLGSHHHQRSSSCDLTQKDNSAVDDTKYLHKPGYSYGCSFCCAEGRVTSVYGTAETLLRHVAEAHAAPAVAGRQQLSADALARTKCVIGRTPEKTEEWDVWFPGFQAQGIRPLAL